MDSESPHDLSDQVAELTASVRRLEQTLQQLGVLDVPSDVPPAAGRVSKSAAAAARGAAAGTAEPSSPPGRVAPAPPPGVTTPESREIQIGSQLFNRVGIITVLIGMAWFLKYAIDNDWIGPAGRVLIGLVTGAGLILWSERFRSRGYATFSYSLKAIGSGVLYLSLWAAYGLYHLVPPGIAFFGMILVTVWNGFMAWVQDAELLALYAIVGGIATPVLVSTGENHEIVLFGYVLVLDLAVVTLVALRPWSRLVVAAFAGTVLLIAGWASAYYTDAAFGVTALFVTLFFLLFAVAPRLSPQLPRRLRDLAQTATLGAWDRRALVVLPLANAALTFVAFYLMLDTQERRWAQPWVAVAFAAFYLLLLRQLPTSVLMRPATGEAGLQSATVEDVAQAELLASIHLVCVIVFLTIAIPLKARGYWVTTGWLIEGGALVWVARRFAIPLLQRLAIAALALGLLALLGGTSRISGPVIFNARFAAHLVGIAAFAITAWLASRGAPPRVAQTSRAADEHLPDTTGTNADRHPIPPVAWKLIAAASVVVVNFLILLAGVREIHAYWWPTPLSAYEWVPPDPSELARRAMYEQFGYSVWAMLFGGVLLAAGFWKRSAFLRWQALVLLTLNIAKVFLVDTAQLSQGYRILSFLGLGALLLIVSFAYQRDWLQLRDRATHAARSPQEPSQESSTS